MWGISRQLTSVERSYIYPMRLEGALARGSLRIVVSLDPMTLF